MFFQLIKKDLLILIRNKHVLITLLIMPIVLISILGFALGGLMDNETSAIKAEVYLIEHGSEEKDLNQFISEVQQSSNLPEEAKKSISEVAKRILPIKMLKEKVLNNDGLKKNIKFHVAKPSELNKIKNNNSVSAIIEVPDQFTLNFLRKIILNEEKMPKLLVLRNEGKEVSAAILEEILTDFQEQYAFSSILEKEKIMVKDLTNITPINISKETVNNVPSINAATYYTIGMSTMFVMYVASLLASFALQEKQLHLYNRIVLSNLPSWMYLESTFVSGIIVGCIQLCILYGVSTLLFDVSIPNIPSFLLITFILSVGIGGFTVLLTAISYRANKETVANVFSNFFVSIFAFLGGSFVPISSFPDWFQTMGSYTINGAALKAYMKMMQGFDVSGFSSQLITMLLYGCLLFMIAVLIFPRRGEA
ncbi:MULTISPECIES: ABC transporter permease [Bacillus]|uniref:ABC transporter permease n=1 Tax=Bacillus TaxID=1386 RepID=UPI000313FBFC|nr:MULTISPECIES: ABC transporter permease [Bacillus]